MRRQLPRESRKKRRQEHIRRLREPSREEHELWIEKRHRAGERRADTRGNDLDRRGAGGVAGAGTRDHRAAVAATRQLASDSVERTAGGVPLEPAEALMALI